MRAKLKNMFIKIIGYYSKLIDYFPEYEENPEYALPKGFMWDKCSTKTQLWQISIYHTLWRKEITKMIKEKEQ